MGGGGGVTPTSTPSSPSCSSEILPLEFAEYVAVAPVSDGDESDECCVCDDAEVEALHYASRRLQDRSLREAKDLIRRYKPGDWIEGAGGTKAGDYVLPEITTLLLVGPRCSGKSTLVNRITSVFDKDDDPFAPDRVQVSRNSKSNGTIFLREYPIPRNSNAICIYDTQSLSSNPKKNFQMLHQWVTKGVSPGEMATWDADDGTMIKDIKPSGRKYSFLHCKTRKVNYVIFVVDGTSVLESTDGKNKEYTEILREAFMYPFLSIGDDKPVVVVTHGDRLSMKQRAHVQNELAELFGIPVQQIFDIPGSDDYQTDLAILDMLRYCIQHAEQNLPVKLSYLLEV
ncbi:hypothetical protein PR202_gb24483 [Eleusine coracana subsp. coracana]|uniref:G domain-containing protein n=1 Tax=Eleusine coracana subsp. coracana TaxID=191504 RepID=A0AAV5FMN9_ELECO|nr:hypothetical protein PR202_gb24483 [Eleusine coracana subsp. coracana]